MKSGHLSGLSGGIILLSSPVDQTFVKGAGGCPVFGKSTDSECFCAILLQTWNGVKFMKTLGNENNEKTTIAQIIITVSGLQKTDAANKKKTFQGQFSWSQGRFINHSQRKSATT